MFTSGSTGQPKGVAVPHQAIARLVFGNDYLPFNERQTFLLLAPTAFDASTLELWGPLLHGARLVVYPEEMVTFDALERVLHEHRVSCLWLTSALFNAVVDQRPKALSGVAQVMTGGEALSAGHVRRAYAALPGTRITNGYGPTESTTFTCTHGIPAHWPSEANTVPIGRPIGNTTVYVLDPELEPVGLGIPGELYIGGDGLAAGYWNRPELTAERFIPHPFSPLPGARLYRSGDLVRWRADGMLDFLGRTDHQVKLRGFRVELEEIEAALGAHPQVKQAAVLIREQDGHKQLHAYVAYRGHPPPAAAALQTHLAGRLPEYMVPTGFALLTDLPLTPNGKVDRQALSALALPAPAEHHTYVAPRDDWERQLAGLWQEVLRRPRIGIHDDFFDLGGNSLVALRLVSRMSAWSQREIPISVLFKAPTIAGLAALLKDESWTPDASPLVPIKAGGSRPPLFVMHAGGGEVLFYSGLARRLDPRQPVYGLRARGVDRRAEPRTSVPEMARHYVQEILRVQRTGPFFLGGVCLGAFVALEAACLLEEQGHRLGFVAVFDTYGDSQSQDILPTPERSWWGRFRHQVRERGFPGFLRHACKRLQRAAGGKRDQLIHWALRLALRHAVAPSRLPGPLYCSYVRAMHEMAIHAHQKRPMRGRVVFFQSEESAYRNPLRPWQRWATEGVTVYPVPGYHTEIFNEPHVQRIAEHLQRELNKFA